MLTLKNLLKQMPKLEIAPVDDEEYSKFANRAMAEWFSICTICKGKFKNYLGVILHTAKKHRKTYLLAQKMRHLKPTPYIKVNWESR